MRTGKFDPFIEIKNTGSHYQQATQHVGVSIKDPGSLYQQQVDQPYYRKRNDGIVQYTDHALCGQKGAKQDQQVREISNFIEIVKFQVVHVVKTIPPRNDLYRNGNNNVNNK
jgi:hypothetical protein